MHGWGGNCDSFAAIARSFSKTHRVTLVDFYGFGKSPHPLQALTLQDYASGVLEIIEKTGMKNVSVIGHSFGGRVAILLAQTYAFDKIVLVDSAGIKPRRKLSYYWKVYSYKLAKKLHLSTARFKGSEDYSRLSPVMKKTFCNIVNYDLSPLIKQITAPTLIYWGKNDKATPMYMAKKMNRWIKNSGLVVVEGGHYAYLEQSAHFSAILRSFLRS